MRPTIPLLLGPLLLTGSVAFSSAPRGDDRAAPPGAVRCIDPHQIVARHAEKPNAVVFEMAGGITYRNDLIGACPGAARATGASIVQIEATSGNLCANDHVRVYDPVEARGTGAAMCRLGTFTPIPTH
ncbi:MAG TPA: hypothetical protein VH331_03055 [Allosphingosinicella sp.]|jgi:hypothetical protein|nr:hypothetical protein [Allosphingosinicella sp.]